MYGGDVTIYFHELNNTEPRGTPISTQTAYMEMRLEDEKADSERVYTQRRQ